MLKNIQNYCFIFERRLLFLISVLFYGHFTFAQNSEIELTFTGIDSLAYARLDSIKVINRTQSYDTILYWPDTSLVLKLIVGIEDNDNRFESFVLKSIPNPVLDYSTIKVYTPQEGYLTLNIFDIFGKKLTGINKDMSEGMHSFRFVPGNEIVYFVSATWCGCHRTNKLINLSQYSQSHSSISYVGTDNQMLLQKSSRKSNDFNYFLGDTLLYVGYTDILESGILGVPDSNQTYIFQFAHNIPCLGIPTLLYEGQVYNTIQIFSQCWLKENLNVGMMILGDSNMTDNGIIEKYCYNDEPDSCTKYGGLYQWNELMQYNPVQGSRGICPPGWHIPTDDEWKVLEGATDSLFGIGDDVWESETFRGFDVAKNLKSTSNWISGGNGSDKFGFHAMPGGGRIVTGTFLGIRDNAFFRLSTEAANNSSSAWNRGLYHDYDKVYRSYSFKINGGSVRCIKD